MDKRNLVSSLKRRLLLGFDDAKERLESDDLSNKAVEATFEVTAVRC